jgi:peptidoglycan/LPS O-acetylase OafA/YrhL
VAALDGLRGLALVIVVVSHAAPQWLPGGFLGVDLFFVLSGYLITAGLLVEQGRTGRIALGRFVARRFRRLGPALLLLLGVPLLFAAAAGGDLAGNLIDAAAIVAGIANWTLALGYDHPGPLAHTWSLSVENQFYLVWPLALPLLAAGGARRARLLLVAAILGLAAWRVWLLFQGASPMRLFEGADTRAGALLMGGLLAWLTQRGSARADRWLDRAAALSLPVLGLGTAACLTVDWTDPLLFEGGLEVAALASALLVAACLSRRQTQARRLFEAAPARRLGEISYGVYLWHFPLIWTIAGNPETASPPAVLFAVLLSLVVATASYEWVEQPLLRRRWGAAVPQPA